MIRIAPQAGFLLRWLLNSRVGSRPLQVGGGCLVLPVPLKIACNNLPLLLVR